MGKAIRCPECGESYRTLERLEDLRDNDGVCMVCNAPIEVPDWDRILATHEDEEDDLDDVDDVEDLDDVDDLDDDWEENDDVEDEDDETFEYGDADGDDDVFDDDDR